LNEERRDWRLPEDEILNEPDAERVESGSGGELLSDPEETMVGVFEVLSPGTGAFSESPTLSSQVTVSW